MLFIPLSRIVFLGGLKARIKFIDGVNPGIMIPCSTWSLTGFFKSPCADVQDTAGVNELRRLERAIKGGPDCQMSNPQGSSCVAFIGGLDVLELEPETWPMSGTLIIGGRLTRQHDRHENLELKA